MRETRFRTQKTFCAHAERYDYHIPIRRYGAIERGAATPNQAEIIIICKAMEISADAWLLGKKPPIDTTWLSDVELKIIRDLMAGLQSLR